MSLHRGILALLCLFGSSVSPWALAKLNVVTSTTHIAAIARSVGGDAVSLKSLMGPGVDPHLYKATARDVIDLKRADLILYNGLHLEGRLAESFSKVGKGGRPIVAVANSIPKEKLLPSANYADAHDPHVWFDPTLWVYVVDAVVEALLEADSENASLYRSNGEAYKREVSALYDWTVTRFEEVPEDRRVLITSHDAYNYFGRAFGIEVVGVQGISTATEAGLADIVKMVDFIKERRIPAIFVESSVSPSTIQRVSKDSGAVVGGELFSDALGLAGNLHEGSDGESYDVGTYIGMFKYNVDTIARALR